MASKYARAVGGNWSADATWSTTSGGAADTTAPTAADDVFIDASSGNVTVDVANVYCRSINCTGYTGTLNGGAFDRVINIGDATAGASNIAFKFVAGMTYSNGCTFKFVSTSATVQTIDWGGKSTGFVTFDGAGGSWQYISTHTQPSSTNMVVTLTRGTLDTNGQTCSWSSFNSSNSNTRTLTLGASAITITSAVSGIAWNTSTTSGLTITANTATITISGATSTFTGGGGNYNGATIAMTGSGTATTSGAFTCANFTRTGTAAKTDTLSVGNNFVCTGTFTCNGNSATNRLLVQSNTVGTARTITAATVSVTNSDFQDITGSGAGSWDLSAITGNSGDCGGNSGITFTTAATQTWDGTSGGNWSTNAWSGRVPLPQDDVIINAAFSASQTVTGDMPRLGKSIDWTGATGSPTYSNSIATIFFGSLTLISGMSWSGSSSITPSGRSNFNLTTSGKTISGAVLITAPSGTYTLLDALTTSGAFEVRNGGFNDGGFSISATNFTAAFTTVRNITATGTWTLTATAAISVFNINSTNLTFNGSGMTIVIGTTSSNTRIFVGANQTYGTLTYTLAGSTGALTINNGNTFGTINFSDVTNARTLTLPAGATTTILNSFNVNGTSGKLMTVTSGTGHTLSKSSGTISCDYLNLVNSTATGGASWYAGANSTDGTGNTGWIFSAAPATGGDGKGGGSIQSLQNLLNLRSL